MDDPGHAVGPRRIDHVGRAVDVDRPVVLPRADHPDLGREVDHRVAPSRRRPWTASRSRTSPRCCSIAAWSVSPEPERPSPALEADGGVTTTRERTGDPVPIRLDAPVTRTFTTVAFTSEVGLVGRRGRHRPTLRARFDRSSRCVGCRPATSARSARRPPDRRRAHERPRSPRPTRDRPATSVSSSTTTICWTPTRADADDGAPGDRKAAFDGPFDRDRSDRAADGRDHVHEPALDPQASEFVEVPDVARIGAIRPRSPAGPSARWPTGSDSRRTPRVRRRGSRRSHPVGERIDRTGRLRRSRTDAPSTGRPTQTPPAGSSSVAASMPARSMSAIGNASVIPYGVCRVDDGARAATACSVSGGTGAPAEKTMRSPSRPGQLRTVRRRGDDVGERRRRAERQRRLDPRARCVERGGGQLTGLGDVTVGQAGRNAEGRTVERERCECGDEPIVAGDPVGPGERVTLRGQLAMPVADTLGRAGGARREQDRRQVVAGRLVRQESARHPGPQIGQILDGDRRCPRRPAQRTRGEQRPPRTDHPGRAGCS